MRKNEKKENNLTGISSLGNIIDDLFHFLVTMIM